MASFQASSILWPNHLMSPSVRVYTNTMANHFSLLAHWNQCGNIHRTLHSILQWSYYYSSIWFKEDLQGDKMWIPFHHLWQWKLREANNYYNGVQWWSGKSLLLSLVQRCCMHRASIASWSSDCKSDHVLSRHFHLGAEVSLPHSQYVQITLRIVKCNGWGGRPPKWNAQSCTLALIMCASKSSSASAKLMVTHKWRGISSHLVARGKLPMGSGMPFPWKTSCGALLTKLCTWGQSVHMVVHTIGTQGFAFLS